MDLCRHSETLFTNPNIVSIMPANQNIAEVRLQLNSRVFSYELSQDNVIEIGEHYRIKGGPLIGSHIGTWSPEKGIIFDIPMVSFP